MTAHPEASGPDGEYEEAAAPQIRPKNEEAPEETPACQSCRKKKSKCSRQQPCSQCVKSGVECTYEDRRLKGGIKTGVVERISQRIDALENMFLGQGILLQQFMRDVVSGNSVNTTGRQGALYPPATLMGGEPPAQLRVYADQLRETLTSLAADGDHGRLVEDATGTSQATTITPSTTATTGTAAIPAANAATITTTTASTTAAPVAVSATGKHKRAFEPFIPSKRRPTITLPANDLCAVHPLPKAIEDVLAVYFKLVHPWMPVLHPATFSRRVREPDRPEGLTMILNAVVAVAAKFVSKSNPDEVLDLGEYADVCRRRVIASAAEVSSIDAVQALLLVVMDTLNSGSSSSPWSLVALVARKIDDLRLFTEDPSLPEGVCGEFFMHTSQFPQPQPATTWLEVEEQRRVFWLAFLMDRFCSISTGSSPMIASKSVRRRLPCDGCMWERDQAVETSYFKPDDQPQNDEAATVVDEPSSFSLTYSNREDSNNIGGLAYTIEATEALSLIAKFNLRHPLRPENASQLSVWLNRFRQLDSQLLQWDLSLTQKWRDVRVVNGYIDPNLTQAHLTHNAAIIMLHRTLAHPLPQTRMWLSGLISAASRESCITAAMKIDKISRRYLAVSDGIVPPQFALSLFIAGQVLLAQASYFAVQPPDEVGSIISSLNEVSRRLSVDAQDYNMMPETPAAKLARALADQRDHDLPTSQPPGLGVSRPQKAAHFPDFYQVNTRDAPNVLQHCIPSVSSGVSPGDLVSFRQDDSVTDLVAQSMIPGGRNLPWPLSAPGMGRQVICDATGVETSPGDRDFDLFAEIRRLEPRGKEPG